MADVIQMPPHLERYMGVCNLGRLGNCFLVDSGQTLHIWNPPYGGLVFLGPQAEPVLGIKLEHFGIIHYLVKTPSFSGRIALLFTIGAVLMESLQRLRNVVLHGGQLLNLWLFLKQALERAEEFNARETCDPSVGHKSRLPATGWQCPPSRRLKFNTNAAFKDGRAGSGSSFKRRWRADGGNNVDVSYIASCRIRLL